MQHPLVGPRGKEIRGLMLELLKYGYEFRPPKKFIFVCGGDIKENNSVRAKFREFCRSNYKDIELFMPEWAYSHYNSIPDAKFLNLSEFEDLIAKASQLIVLFPESPGSFAELGYFSANDKINQKVLLVLDSEHADEESFIALGPASILNKESNYRSNISISYKNPDFLPVIGRINKRFKPKNFWQNFTIKKFKDTELLEIFALIQTVIYLLIVPKVEDLLFIFRALYLPNFSEDKFYRILSILIGWKKIKYVNDYGHLGLMNGHSRLAIKVGQKKEEDDLRTDIGNLIFKTDSKLAALMTEACDA